MKEYLLLKVQNFLLYSLNWYNARTRQSNHFWRHFSCWFSLSLRPASARRTRSIRAVQSLKTQKVFTSPSMSRRCSYTCQCAASQRQKMVTHVYKVISRNKSLTNWSQATQRMVSNAFQLLFFCVLLTPTDGASLRHRTHSLSAQEAPPRWMQPCVTPIPRTHAPGARVRRNYLRMIVSITRDTQEIIAGLLETYRSERQVHCICFTNIQIAFLFVHSHCFLVENKRAKWTFECLILFRWTPTVSTWTAATLEWKQASHLRWVSSPALCSNVACDCENGSSLPHEKCSRSMIHTTLSRPKVWNVWFYRKKFFMECENTFARISRLHSHLLTTALIYRLQN